MSVVTREQVQMLVKQLPEAELPVAHRFLTHLVEEPKEEEPFQEQFLKLPLAERRRLMEKQAADAVGYYEENRKEIDEWLSGDFVDY